MGPFKGIGCGCGCLVAVLAVVGFSILMIAMILSLVGSKMSSDGERLLGESAVEYGEERPECERPLDMKWMCGEGGENDPWVVYIPMRGEIAATDLEGGLFAETRSDYAMALRSIRVATRDEDVRGICLMLDTPGGTVTDSDIMADALRRFKAADTNRFVLVMMGAMCCSGGYYVAAEADYIMANPTTLTGSIGVIMSGLNAAELAKKVGVKSVIIASGANKALLDPLEPVDPKHVEILRRPVACDYERFISIVAQGRKLPLEEVRKIADGRVFSAEDAVKAHLVDGLGYAEEAWEKAAELAEADDVRIYRYEEPFSWRSIFSPQTFVTYGRAFFSGMLSGAKATTPHNEYRLP